MTRADRIVRAREQERQRATDEASRRAEVARKLAADRQRMRVQDLARQAVNLLNKKGWPDGKVLRVPMWETHRGGYRGPIRKRAGVRVGSWTSTVGSPEQTRTYTVWLLSDGRVGVGDPPPYTIRPWLYDSDLDCALQGLETIVRRCSG